jgi:hypothetical protein
MTVRIVILSVLIMSLFSCRKYRLSDSDLVWQPYKVGDQLIFESNRGERDSITIKSIETHTNPDDPLAVFPSNKETLFVVDNAEILKLEAEKNGSYVQFRLRLGDNSLVSPWVLLDLNRTEIDRLEITDFSNKKVYKIMAKESKESLKDRPFDLRYIYWSKEYGYLGLEFKDGYIWKLKSFNRDKENIL